jgi:hypothetical protein
MTSIPHNGTSTSIAAARSQKGKTCAARQKVLETIEKCGAQGATREEVSDLTGMLPDTVRPRCVELINEGRLAPAPFVRLTRTGRKAEVLLSVRQ